MKLKMKENAEEINSVETLSVCRNPYPFLIRDEKVLLKYSFMLTIITFKIMDKLSLCFSNFHSCYYVSTNLGSCFIGDLLLLLLIEFGVFSFMSFYIPWNFLIWKLMFFITVIFLKHLIFLLLFCVLPFWLLFLLSFLTYWTLWSLFFSLFSAF